MGLHVKIAQDFDKDCVATMRANNHRVVGGDIRDIEPQDLLSQANLLPGEPFLICGGPPCQPFSTAGKRLGINDPRGSLFMDFIRMIDYIQPRFFIMENVKGILSAPLKHGSVPDNDYNFMMNSTPKKSVLEVLLDEFNKLGYRTTYGVLDAVNYGVPQFRERFVIIGSRDHEEIYLPIPTHFERHQETSFQWKTLSSAISDLENNFGECTSFSPERMRFLKMVPEGGNWKDIPEHLVPEAMGGAYQSGGGKVGFYRRLAYGQPSPTLVTSPVQKASMLCHPTSNRPLSVKEYARIQQFPEEWIFIGNTASKYRQIGNAVPIGLAMALGKAIVSVAEGNSTIKTKRMRGTNIHNRIKQAIEIGGK